MKLTLFSGALIIALLIGVVSCEKIVRGPQGAEGTIGEQGPQGPAGDTGPIGDPGTIDSVNVFYSDWVDPDNWIDSAGSRYATIPSPEITQEVIDKGLVIVYYKYQKGSTLYIYKMPFKGTYTSPHSIRAIIRVGEILIESSYDIKTADDLESFRYSIVPLGS